MTVARSHVLAVIETLLSMQAYRTTKFVSPKLVIRATRRLYGGKVPGRGQATIILTIGSPNYIERDFIRVCKQAGERFPVRRVRIKFPPVRRSKAKRRR